VEPPSTILKRFSPPSSDGVFWFNLESTLIHSKVNSSTSKVVCTALFSFSWSLGEILPALKPKKEKAVKNTAKLISFNLFSGIFTFFIRNETVDGLQNPIFVRIFFFQGVEMHEQGLAINLFKERQV